MNGAEKISSFMYNELVRLAIANLLAHFYFWGGYSVNDRYTDKTAFIYPYQLHGIWTKRFYSGQCMLLLYLSPFLFDGAKENCSEVYCFLCNHCGYTAALFLFAAGD